MNRPRPLTTIHLDGRTLAVRRSAVRPRELAAVVGESERAIIDRLRCGDLAGVLGSPTWLVRSESAAALVEDKVRAGVLSRDGLDAFARLIEDRIPPARQRSSQPSPLVAAGADRRPSSSVSL